MKTDIEILKLMLAEANKIAEKNIDKANNIDLHNMCETLEGMIDELDTIGEFQLCDETPEPKEFLITETYPATVVRKYRVTATSEEEAEMKILEGEVQPFWTNQSDDLGEMEVDIKPYVEEQNT